ncbi:MAG: glycosyltransferase family 39 protein [Acidobacteria bacterium]|nr:glycosyltransferase family 39 protein [Acidobacteriota bacterium]MCB9399150.1 glycosyltransferase family 39 protein [Acidobacteriota bacterium]
MPGFQSNRSAQFNARFYGAAALFCFVVLAYFRMRENLFVAIDDPGYLWANPHVRQGLSWANIQWAFTSFDMNNWHPLTWISFMLDVSLYGMKPGAHHMVGLILHALNCILFYFCLYHLIGRWRPAFLGALLLAVHPIHVESVAWASERKDLLSLFFLFLTLIQWDRWVQNRRISAYMLSLLWYACSLMSKPTMVTLPVLFLVLDMVIYGRITKLPDVWRTGPEKGPFWLLAFGSGWLTLLAQSQNQGIQSIADFSLVERMVNAWSAYGAYLQHFVLPFGLAPQVPIQPEKLMLGALVSLIIFSVLVWLILNTKNRYLVGGLAWWAIALLPVAGLIKVGEQAWADRYAYIPFLGLYTALAFCLKKPMAKHPSLATAVMVAMGLFLCFLTFRQVGHWRDSQTYTERIAAVYPGHRVANGSLANLARQRGEFEKAKGYLSLIPSDNWTPETHLIMARIAYGQKDWPMAESAYLEAARGLTPLSAIANAELGNLYLRQQKWVEAEQCFIEADRYYPEFQLSLAGRFQMAMLRKDQALLLKLNQRLKSTPPVPYLMVGFLQGSLLMQEWVLLRKASGPFRVLSLSGT